LSADSNLVEVGVVVRDNRGRAIGGLFFHNNNDLDLGFRELGVVPEVAYLLGLSPEEAPNGKNHSLKVRLKPSIRSWHDLVTGRLRTSGRSRLRTNGASTVKSWPRTR
jgi:hypothetical protein